MDYYWQYHTSAMKLWLLSGLMLSVFDCSICTRLEHQQHNKTTVTEYIDDLLKGYDERLTPTFYDSTPTIVTCDIFVSNVDSINEPSMDFGVTVYLRQMWRDKRLEHDPDRKFPTSSNLLPKLWKPDLFFFNGKSGVRHDLTTDNVLLRISPDGDVFISERLSLKLHCQMTLQMFPMDHQECEIQMESFGYTNESLVFKWKDDGDPVQLGKELALPHFILFEIDTVRCDKEYWTGNFTCISVSFHFTRQLGFYVLNTYGPTFALVVLSWISFWMSADAAPARICLGITVILTTTTQTIGQRGNMAKVSYITAFDIWMATCFVFVMGAIVEFSIANFLHHMGIRYNNKTKRSNSKVLKKNVTKNSADKVQETMFSSSVRHRLNSSEDEGYNHIQQDDVIVAASMSKRYFDMSLRLDKASRVLFPLTFIIFNILYWSIFLSTYINGYGKPMQ
ncbi:glycine receptor subunit alpha-2-like [Glandiceps talaboti]